MKVFSYYSAANDNDLTYFHKINFADKNIAVILKMKIKYHGDTTKKTHMAKKNILTHPLKQKKRKKNQHKHFTEY